jgi:Cu(I)-responsive transcriptional regulator
MARGMTIGALARATGTKAKTIRYYERSGLLPVPGRTGGNYRDYSPAHLGRLRFLRRLRALGFSLAEIRALLALADEPAADCAAVTAIARSHLEEVERKLADLEHLRQQLSAIIGRCPGGRVAECGIIEALAPGERPGPGPMDLAGRCAAAGATDPSRTGCRSPAAHGRGRRSRPAAGR